MLEKLLQNVLLRYSLYTAYRNTKRCLFFLAFLLFPCSLAADTNDPPLIIGIEENKNNTSLHERWVEETIKKIRITGKESVLDLECGDGAGAAKLARFFPFGNVVGIDNHLTPITLAQKRFGGESFSHLYFLCADPQDIAYKEEFNIIVSYSWFHLVHNQKLVLKKIHESLKPGGIFAMCCFVDIRETPFIQALDLVAKQSEWQEYFARAEEVFAATNASQCEQFLKEAGLTPLVIDVVKNHEIFMTHQIFIDWMQPWIEAMKRPEISSLLFARVYNQFARDVLRAYTRLYPSDERGYIHLEDCEIHVEAKKT